MRSEDIRTIGAVLLLGASRTKAWQFPGSSSSYPTAEQKPLGRVSGVGVGFGYDDDDVDIAYGSLFNGLTTYANIPYVDCFSAEEEEGQSSSSSDKYDIAILGAPFDTVSNIARTAMRFDN